jgi:hypothetical protein
MPLGIGKITVEATVKASNADEISKTAEGFIFLFYVFLM